MRKQLTTQGSNEVTEPNFINDIDYANKLGARPTRLVTKPKRFEDFAKLSPAQSRSDWW